MPWPGSIADPITEVAYVAQMPQLRASSRHDDGHIPRVRWIAI